MMINLNLLAPAKKIRLVHLFRFLLVKELLEFVTFMICTLATAHVLGWLVLTSALTDLFQSMWAINKAAPAYQADTAALNTTIKQLGQASADFLPLSPLLFKLIDSLPPDIKLTALALNRDTNKLTLTGVAKTRAALLAWQEQLKKMPWLANPAAPISQLLEKDNVPFELSAQLKLTATSIQIYKQALYSHSLESEKNLFHVTHSFQI